MELAYMDNCESAKEPVDLDKTQNAKQVYNKGTRLRNKTHC